MFESKHDLHHFLNSCMFPWKEEGVCLGTKRPAMLQEKLSVGQSVVPARAELKGAPEVTSCRFIATSDPTFATFISND